LKALDVEEGPTLPYVLQLLSVKDSGLNNILISPEAKKERFIEALKVIVLKGSKLRPLILAIEDLHWIDKSSEELLQYLLDDISGNRVFLIFTYRPEYVPFWGVKSYHSQVNLNRLVKRESLAMVAHFLGADDIGQDLQELILEKTEGVPFFVEEFIRSLKDLKVIERKNEKYHFVKKVKNFKIPSTIQDVIMARVDSLPENAKEILQTGSVVEREFSHELIKQLTSLPENDLLLVFSALKNSELIYERGLYPENTYIFKHALTREVVYNSLLALKRQELHEKIGNAIEELYQKDISQYYGVLAEHYIKCRNYDKGSKYAKLAGRKAVNESAFAEAVFYAQKSTFCIEKLPPSEKNQRKLIDARTVQGVYFSMTNYHVEAKEAVDPIIDSAIRLGYKKRLTQIYNILGTYYCTVDDDFEKAFAFLEKALNFSEETQDYYSLVNASLWLGLARSYNCEFEKSRSISEKGLELVTAANQLSWISAFKGNMSVFAYLLNGRTDLGYQFSLDSVEAAEENDDIFAKGLAYTSLGYAFYDKGLFERALKNMQIASDFLQRTKFYSWDSIAHHVMGDIHLQEQRLKMARVHFEKSISLLEQNRLMPAWINLNKLCLALVSIMDHKKDFNLEILRSYVKLNKIKLFDGWMRRYLAEILLYLNEQHLSEAENWIQKAIKRDQRNDLMLHLAKDYALFAEILQRKGNRITARENFGKAIEICKQCGADGWVEKYEKELATLS
jgi:predicted ATPase